MTSVEATRIAASMSDRVTDTVGVVSQGAPSD